MPVCKELEAVLHDLMGTDDEIVIVLLKEFGHDLPAKQHSAAHTHTAAVSQRVCGALHVLSGESPGRLTSSPKV